MGFPFSTIFAAHFPPCRGNGVPNGTSPFVDEVPKADAQGTYWLEPTLVVDVETHGAGYERLRQPAFQGVRSDVSPEDLT